MQAVVELLSALAASMTEFQRRKPSFFQDTGVALDVCNLFQCRFSPISNEGRAAWSALQVYIDRSRHFSRPDALSGERQAADPALRAHLARRDQPPPGQGRGRESGRRKGGRYGGAGRSNVRFTTLAHSLFGRQSALGHTQADGRGGGPPFIALPRGVLKATAAQRGGGGDGALGGAACLRVCATLTTPPPLGRSVLGPCCARCATALIFFAS